MSDPKAPSLPRPRRRRDTVIAAVAIFLGVFALYARAITFDQVIFDDELFVFQNTHVAQGLTWSNFIWAMTDTSTTGWYPLHHLSYMLDTTLWGHDAWGYHLTNVLLHALNAALLFVALRWMTGSLWASVAATLLFAVHPMRVESVAWISERKGVLSALFWVLTMLAYLRYAARPTVARYAPIMVFMALGLMAKALLVTLPCALLLLDYWPLRRWRPHADPTTAQGAAEHADTRFAPASLGRLIVEKLPLLGLAVVDVGIMYFAQTSAEAFSVKYPKPLLTRLVYAAEACVLYMRDTVWPHDLMTPHMMPSDFAVGPAVGAAALLLVVTIVVVVAWRRAPAQRGYLPVGWLWYLGVLTPMLGVVFHLLEFSRADRYTYLPSIGLSVLIVWPIARFVSRHPKARLPVTCAVVAAIVALSGATYVQAGRWRNAEALFQYTLTIEPDNAFAHHFLAQYYDHHNDPVLAEKHLRRLIEVAPEDNHLAPLARYDLGKMLEAQGRIEEAVHWYEEANRVSGGPGNDMAQARLGELASERGETDEAERRYRAALKANDQQIDAWFGIGMLFAGRGDMESAHAAFTNVTRLDAKRVDAWYNLGLALGRLNRTDEALEALRQATTRAPRNADYRRAYGNALMTANRPAEAAEAYAALLELAPDNADTRMRLGMALGRSGAIDKALPHLEAATRLAPDKAVHWFNLGMVYRALHRNDDAAAAFNKALAVDPKFNDARRQLDAMRAAPAKP
ncbi:MAG: tetratricopeptide repeat protein [Phycisphaera sp.]|nr:tetratricopeptide repeat protein [Phycisphaera sp.]